MYTQEPQQMQVPQQMQEEPRNSLVWCTKCTPAKDGLVTILLYVIIAIIMFNKCLVFLKGDKLNSFDENQYSK
jgi:hypothetical protein